MEEILKVEGLRKTFKQTKKLFSKQNGGGIKVAVDNLSFTAYKGEILSLIHI